MGRGLVAKAERPRPATASFIKAIRYCILFPVSLADAANANPRDQRANPVRRFAALEDPWKTKARSSR
jgi:hypothetical protein